MSYTYIGNQSTSLQKFIAGDANTAHRSQNTTGVYANTAFEHANASYVSQNTTGTYANTGYEHANAAYGSQNTTGTYANTGYEHANAAYVSQNTTGVYANAAYEFANTKFAASGGTLSGDVVITGSLTVSGDVTYVNTTELNIGDNIINLNADVDQLDSPTESAGIQVERGIEPNVQLLWVEGTDKWSFTNDGTSFSAIASASAEVYANTAFDRSNVADQRAITSGNYANSSFAISNTLGTSIASAASYANGAFISQNTTGVYANAAYESQNTTGRYANASYEHANAAYVSQNTTGVYANAAFDHSNTRFAVAGGTISGDVVITGQLDIHDPIITLSAGVNQLATPTESAGIEVDRGVQANSYLLWDENINAWKFSADDVNFSNVGSQAAEFYANSSYLHANAAYVSQNSTGNYANTGYEHANAAYVSQNTTGLYSNTAYEHANAAYISQNTTGVYANVGYTHANAAYEFANTKFASSGGTLSGDVVITGNLTVSGTSVYVQTEILEIDDNIIDLNSNFTSGTPTENAGLRIIRGDETPIIFRWNETVNAWQFTNDGNIYSNVSSAAAEVYANTAYEHANNSYLHANAAYVSQNSTGNYANTGYEHANAAYVSQNTTGVYANSAYVSQNTTGVYANAAYTHANTKFAASGGTVSGDVTITGILSVEGSVSFFDNTIDLNSDLTSGTPTENSGIRVLRGDEVPVQFRWDESFDKWTFTTNGVNYQNLASESVEVYANAAFDAANLAFTAGGTIAGGYANSAYLQANASYESQNTTGVYANVAYEHANSAFDRSNTSPKITVSDSSPTNNLSGDLWWDSDRGRLKIYYTDVNSSQWVDATPVFYTEEGAGADEYARAIANASFDTANSSSDYANSAFTTANNAATISYVDTSISNLIDTAPSTLDTLNELAAALNDDPNFSTSILNTIAVSGEYANAAYENSNTANVTAIQADQRSVTSGLYANSAYDQANTATTDAAQADQRAVTSGVYANSAFDFANTLAGGTATDGWVRNTANASYEHANASYISSNTVGVYANAAFEAANNAVDTWVRDAANSGSSYANSAFETANLAFTAGGTIAGGYANSAYDQANTATSDAAQADQRAVTSGDYANTSYVHANAAFEQANSAYLFGSSASSYANSAYDQANTANTSSAQADQRAVTSGDYANSAYTLSNTNTIRVSTVGFYANAAFDAANNSTDAWVRDAANSASVYANSAYNLANTISTGGTFQLSIVVDSFVGDGVEDTFELSVTPENKDYTSIVIEGVSQLKTSYSLVGANIVFSQPPEDTANIDVTVYTSSVNPEQLTFISAKTNAAFEQANTAYDLSSSGSVYANAAFGKANSASQDAIASGDYANSAYTKANTNGNSVLVADQKAVSAGSYANSAYSQANTATSSVAVTDQKAISAGVYSNAAFGKANTAEIEAIQADQRAVTSGVYANASFSKSNSASQQAVTSGSYANSAYGQANTATNNAATADQKGVSAGSYANSAFGKANTATTNSLQADQRAVTSGVYANASFLVANTVGVYANAAFSKANNNIDAWVRDAANSASSYANGAYELANTGVQLTTENTFTNKQIFTANDNIFSVKVDNFLEKATIVASGAASTINFDLGVNSVLYYTNDATSNWTINFRTSSSTTLNSQMSIGEVVTATMLAKQGSSAYYNTTIQVDGSNKSVKWLSANSATAGNPNAIDVYSYSIIKTADDTYTILVSFSYFG